MSIPAGITHADILEGIQLYHKTGKGDFGESKKYDLIFQGMRYPPKAILGLSTIRLTGAPLRPSDFGGGEETTCFKLLRSLGFEIAPKESRAAWIFQGNPDEFDIEGYIQANEDIRWFVGQEHYREDILPEQTVFFWLAKGRTGMESGVIAVGRIIAKPSIMAADEASRPFARNGFDATALLRVPLKILSRRLGKNLIKKEWLKEDPILRELSILKQAAGTQFPLTDAQLRRLQRLDEKTGYDFTPQDSMIALLAYAETYGGPISLKPGSPVARAALQSGRVLTSVYNKVLNFRSIDPRDSRKGLSGSSDIDKEVWERFYDIDKKELKITELRAAAYHTPETQVLIPESVLRTSLDEQVKNSLGLSDDERKRRLKLAPRKPKKVTVTTQAFYRNPDVIAEVLKQANGICGICTKPAPFKRASDESPYLEVHHKVPLARGGDDTVENSIALCPNCHRNEHHGTKPALIKP